MTIQRIVQTSRAFPSQWEGFMADGRSLYVRFRHGNLSVYVADGDPLADDRPIIDEFLAAKDGDTGSMEYDELREHLARHGITAQAVMDSENRWHESILPAFIELQRRQ